MRTVVYKRLAKSLCPMKRASLFKKIESINNFDENSNYKVLDTLYNVFPLLYEDSIFNEEGSKPVIINEYLLKIEE